tara:strand:- start:273 stop:428 length:156 start_codon:yes stop_codon:yes gene_type:complete
MKIVTILVVCVLLLQGCTLLTIGISGVSSIYDRIEKHQIEKRLKELEGEVK